MKATFLAYCVIIILSGCWANKAAEEAAEGIVNEIQDFAKLSATVLIYEAKNNKWPDSMEDLKAFCSEAKKECFELDWNKYTDVSFEKLPDGRLKIESHRSQDQGKSSFSAILDVPTP